MRLLWLPEVLRSAGLTVHEVSGWKTRGADSYGPVRGITCHHTAGSRNSTDQGEINVLLNGSATAPPPIAQLYLSRSGAWWVIASGLCYHNKIGWGGPNEGYGNDSLLGIEAQHSGGDEPWTATQYNSYMRGVAALVNHKTTGYDVSVTRVAGHKEHQPGDKSDPTFSMGTFRTNVSNLLAKGLEMSFLDDGQHAEALVGRVHALMTGSEKVTFGPLAGKESVSVNIKLNQILATLATLAGKDFVDEEAIATGVLAGLGTKEVEDIANALRAAMTAEKLAALKTAL